VRLCGADLPTYPVFCVTYDAMLSTPQKATKWRVSQPFSPAKIMRREPGRCSSAIAIAKEVAGNLRARDLRLERSILRFF
jgi:hypothetical protein